MPGRPTMHIIGQGPAVLAAGVGQVSCSNLFISSILSFLMPHLLGDG